MQPKHDDSPLLDADALDRIGQLELLSRRTVDGFYVGKHRSTHRGGCCEFTHHRAYTAGDEIRLVDWRIYAKRDRYFIKQFEEETNLQAFFVLDASGSMKFGMSTMTKFDYARAACACLCRLLLRQRDAVGLSIVDTGIRRFVPPRANARHLQALIECLRKATPAGRTSFVAQAKASASRLGRRGLIVLMSDLFTDVSQLTTTLRYLRLRGHEVLVFHVLAPEEIDFQFQQNARFLSLERAGRYIDLDPIAVRAQYLRRFQQFLTDARAATVESGCDYLQVATNQPLADVLSRYLRARKWQAQRFGRAASGRAGRGGAS